MDRSGYNDSILETAPGVDFLTKQYGETDLFLKRKAQAVFEQTHSREEFRRLIGRSYL